MNSIAQERSPWSDLEELKAIASNVKASAPLDMVDNDRMARLIGGLVIRIEREKQAAMKQEAA